MNQPPDHSFEQLLFRIVAEQQASRLNRRSILDRILHLDSAAKTGDEGSSQRKPSVIYARYNSDFEHSLHHFSANSTLPASIVTINQKLAPVMRFLGDSIQILSEESAAPTKAIHPPNFLSHATRAQTEFCYYLPWGVTERTRIEAQRLAPHQPFPALEVVKKVQGRAYGFELEQRFGWASPLSRLLYSLEALEDALESFPTDFVLKHPFGVAGRDRVLGRKGVPLPSGARAWCGKVLKTQPLLLEPWRQRVKDFGMQWYLSPGGEVLFLGALELLNDPQGTYRGHRLGPQTLPPTLIRDGLRIALAVMETGYFGPLGIDAFVWKDECGNEHLRPLVELNARFTMGMCALGVELQLPVGATGQWIHTAEGMTLLPDPDVAPFFAGNSPSGV